MRKNLTIIAVLGLRGSNPPPPDKDIPSTIPAPPPDGTVILGKLAPIGKPPVTVPEVEHTTVINSLQGFLILHVNPTGGGPPQFLGTPFKVKDDANAGAEAEAQARKIPFIPRDKLEEHPSRVVGQSEAVTDDARKDEPAAINSPDCAMPESYKDAESPLCTFPRGHEGLHSWDMDLVAKANDVTLTEDDRPEDS